MYQIKYIYEKTNAYQKYTSVLYPNFLTFTSFYFFTRVTLSCVISGLDAELFTIFLLINPLFMSQFRVEIRAKLTIAIKCMLSRFSTYSTNLLSNGLIEHKLLPAPLTLLFSADFLFPYSTKQSIDSIR